jgi:hypothetical protein
MVYRRHQMNRQSCFLLRKKNYRRFLRMMVED